MNTGTLPVVEKIQEMYQELQVADFEDLQEKKCIRQFIGKVVFSRKPTVIIFKICLL